MELANKILEKGKLEVDLILKTAKEEAKLAKKTLIDEALKDANTRIENVRREANKDLKTKERLLNFERRQAELLAKQNTIDEIFLEVRKKIELLKGSDLLDYVVNQISTEKLVGDEVMHVNNENYERYLNALSSNKEDNLVDLDKLNKKLKTNLKLSNKPFDMGNGFILEGKYFDLNFAIEDVIEKLKTKHERKLVKELFE